MQKGQKLSNDCTVAELSNLPGAIDIWKLILSFYIYNDPIRAMRSKIYLVCKAMWKAVWKDCSDAWFTLAVKEKIRNASEKNRLQHNWFEEYREWRKNKIKCDRIMELAMSGKNCFITGSGGVGKTVLLKKIVKSFAEREDRANSEREEEEGGWKDPAQILIPFGFKKVAVTAATGVAALEIEGSTLHSWAGLGLGLLSLKRMQIMYRDSTEKEKEKEKKRWPPSAYRTSINQVIKRWRSTRTLIIDEISMISPAYFNKLDLFGRWVRGCQSKPFGGIQLLFFGDFLQLRPIPCKDLQSENDLLQSEIDCQKLDFCFELPQWKELSGEMIELTYTQRQENRGFIDMLNRIRLGVPTLQDISLLKGRVSEEDKAEGICPTKLLSLRKGVAEINTRHMNELETESHTYRRVHDTVQRSGKGKIKDNVFSITEDAAERILQQSQIEYDMCLKKDSQVMLTVNLLPEAGLVNGSRGVIVGFEETEKCGIHRPLVLFKNGEVMPIDYHKWLIATEEKNTYLAVCQIPLIPAWAITIHKIQGKTLDFATVDLGKSVFSEGQAYVALSRIRELSGLTLTSFDHTCIRANKKVLNFYNGTLLPTPIAKGAVNIDRWLKGDGGVSNQHLKPSPFPTAQQVKETLSEYKKKRKAENDREGSTQKLKTDC